MLDFKPFRFWCQKVLPAVYDDSLSYYELLCKVVAYLNDMSSQTETQFNNLEKEFNELKSFVDNYFNNLDVQDEIDKKLDELIMNGSFGLYLRDYLGYITPKMFGATGNGTTDDYQKIIDCFNYAVENNVGLIMFPAGSYYISQELKIPYNKDTSRPYFDIKGADSTLTEIKGGGDNVISYTGTARQNLIRPKLESIKINGNNTAKNCIYAIFTGQINFNDVICVGSSEKGVFLDSGCWMFNLKNMYIVSCGHYGLYIADNCAGSNMELVVCELNGINCRIGYSRMINIKSCTFQQYTEHGNVLVQAGWDITFDTNWFEGSAYLHNYNSYDLKLELVSGNNVGHMIRVINNSFHARGQNESYTYWGIYEDYSDTLICGNYFDENNGYRSNHWYVGNYKNARTYGYQNTATKTTPSILSYVLWQYVLGVENDLTIMTDNVRIKDRLTLIPNAGRSYQYDSQIYSNKDTHRIEWSDNGRYWSLLPVVYAGTPPTNGSWRLGDIVLSNNPLAGSYIGWVCTSTSPLTWKPFGAISA